MVPEKVSSSRAAERRKRPGWRRVKIPGTTIAKRGQGLLYPREKNKEGPQRERGGPFNYGSLQKEKKERDLNQEKGGRKEKNFLSFSLNGGREP